MITILCSTFLRYKGKIDADLFAVNCLIGLLEIMIEIIPIMMFIDMRY